MGGFVAEFYENGDKIPVKDFLDSLNVKMRENHTASRSVMEFLNCELR